MSAALIEQIKASPLLPEIIQAGQAELLREQALRVKFHNDITPEHKREFINGEVIMHTPALNRHLRATKRLFQLMSAHCLTRRCGEVHVEKAMTSLPRNDYEPDICSFGIAKASLITPDTLRFPFPTSSLRCSRRPPRRGIVGSSSPITPATACVSIGSWMRWRRRWSFIGSKEPRIRLSPASRMGGSSVKRFLVLTSLSRRFLTTRPISPPCAPRWVSRRWHEAPCALRFQSPLARLKHCAPGAVLYTDPAAPKPSAPLRHGYNTTSVFRAASGA